MKKIITKGLLKRLTDASFTVSESDTDIEFGKYSPAGQDYHFIVNKDGINDLNDLQDKLYDQYNDFDVSQETYNWLDNTGHARAVVIINHKRGETYDWLDNTGHGKNGAPYDRADVYNDMSACQEYIEEARRLVYEYDQREYLGKKI